VCTGCEVLIQGGSDLALAQMVGQVQFACALAHRLPSVAKVFAPGVIDFRMVSTIINRTENVDSDVMPELDEAIARHALK
jgi:uncharacterized protein DUF222